MCVCSLLGLHPEQVLLLGHNLWHTEVNIHLCEAFTLMPCKYFSSAKHAIWSRTHAIHSSGLCPAILLFGRHRHRLLASVFTISMHVTAGADHSGGSRGEGRSGCFYSQGERSPLNLILERAGKCLHFYGPPQLKGLQGLLHEMFEVLCYAVFPVTV